MAVKDHPSRRKSIAVPRSSNRSSIGPRHRRRAHSGVPSALSPLARSRLSGPFKGILKSNLKPPPTEDAPSGSQASSQDSAHSQSNSHTPEVDGDATQSMELTEDFQVNIHDDVTRKSMSRRVSFHEQAFVRLFTRADNTNSTGSPQSSPSHLSSDPPEAPVVNDENAYSRAALARRRSSGRPSFGSDMDLTTIGSTSAVMDESLSDMSADMSYDMEITEAVNQRRRVSMAPRADDSYEIADESISFSEDLSQVEEDDTGPMEFTVPLAQALRPASEDPVWLELQRATHAGTSLASDDGMDDEQLHASAYVHDQATKDGRESLGFGLTGDESFSSMEESFTGPSDESDKTMNLSQAFGRSSLGGQGRLSDAESLMEESETYGRILTTPASTTPASVAPSSSTTPSSTTPSSTTPSSTVSQIYPSALLAQEPPAPVFRPPPAQRSDNVSREAPSSSISSVFSKPKSVFIPKQLGTKPPAPPSKLNSPTKAARSPIKPPTKPTPKQFSAAFAPPVARPSPKKPSSTGPVLKRPLPQDENVSDGPSPPKRANIGKDLQETAAGSNEAPTSTANGPRPLSPSKRAPFEASTNTSTNARPSGIRRPSGYFARRRSMANGPSDIPEDPAPSTPSSPKKKAPLGLGRASMGSGITDAWKRFNRDSDSATTKPLVAKPTVGNTNTSISSPEQVEQSFVSETPVPATDHTVPQDVESTFGLSEGITSATVDRVADAEATEAWRQNVDQEDIDDEDMPVISIEQFFELTGIKFMDDLQAPRRSMHPSHMRQPRHPTEISLADYAIALAIDIPQLALYSRVSSDLQAWMQQSRIIFAEAEEEAGKMTPELFVEYSRADEEGQAELLHQLNLIRTNTRGLAKSDWYDWKLQWIDGLRVTAEQGLKELEADAKTLETLCSQGKDVIPSLQAEYDAVMKELEQEQAEVAEIEKCDQDYLKELKASIADQNTIVEALKVEVREENDQLTWLEERLHEIELQKTQARSAIAEANRILHMQSSSTEVEVFRLRDELEALENIHMFRITKVGAQEFEYEYASQFRVRVPCVNFRPVSSKIQITATESLRSRHKDTFPALSRFFLTCATSFIREDSDRSIREIVHALSAYWSSCSQLRLQFKHVTIGFPVEIVTDTATSSFTLGVSIMFPERKAKAIVTFHFDTATFSQWPCSIESLRHDVEVAYGDLDGNYLSDVITQSLRAKSPSENYACLAEACLEAQRAQ